MMGFCQVCDMPIPTEMTSDGICQGCWREHATSDPDGYPLAKLWAQANADLARGPLLLVEGEGSQCG